MRAPGGRPTVAEIKSLRRQLAEAKADCDHYVDFMMKSSLCESCQKEREVFLRKLGAGKTLRMQLADLQSRYDRLREAIQPLLPAIEQSLKDLGPDMHEAGVPGRNVCILWTTSQHTVDELRAALDEKGEGGEDG
jgi:hypothetical protein